MVRNVLGIISGLVVGFIVTAGIQMLNFRLAPLPEGLTIEDTEGMREHMQNLPIIAFIVVLLSHFIGTGAASYMACMIADNRFTLLAVLLGSFFLLMGVINLFMIQHPVWFSAVDCLIYLPAALLGRYIARPKEG
jgi:hypothetical protein